MSTSTDLLQTQSLAGGSARFNLALPIKLIQVVPTALGTNLTPGTPTFTASGGTTLTGGAGAATWTCLVGGGAGAGRIVGIPVVTNPGEYTATPTVSANAATVSAGASDATWALVTGLLQELYTAGPAGAVLTSINGLSSEPSTARVATLWRQLAAGQPLDFLVAVTIAAAAGTSGASGAVPVDFFGKGNFPGLEIHASGKLVLPAAPGEKFFISVPAVSASAAIRVNCRAEEYAVPA